jgi:hypothetical protein
VSFLSDPSDRLEPAYREPYTRWQQDPSRENTGALLKVLKPEIDRGIRAHVGGRSDPLLRSRAKRLALGAVRSYDSRRAQLGTHVINQLQGLKRISRQQNQILRVPERVSLEQYRVFQVTNELTDELGREPTPVEVADRTGLSTKRLQYLQQFRPALSEGSMLGDSGNDESSAGGLPGVKPLPGARDSWTELVYSELDPINQKILDWSLGLHGAPQLQGTEIARRLRLSTGAITQRKQRIQALLDEGELRSPFS